ncbi:oxidoreductase [Siphonobacter sp. BAB-5385]|uniref:SDR family oxidoreductase n=1 Tax=Siphonobacter sp. BAB-5385 TaxID=1864822 RepID=UPI000B9E77BA|nr:SDR family oxidoreductase [Siphonobacter sp. BAB-5385]OZI05737.1 oxidoreductase [Siphonobacter sp. BAB-5385]
MENISANFQRLATKVVVITGGNTGIGLATAKLFVEHGAHVYITGRSQQTLDEAVSELGDQITAVKADSSKVEDLEQLYSSIKAKHGRIDVLFANAGIAQWEPLGYITEASIDEIFSINVKGTVFTVQKALPLMSAGGSIILNGSISASMGTPAMSVYSASKAAIRSLARSWAQDLRGTGIRVNVLSPGPTATKGVMDGLSKTGQMEAMMEGIRAQSPLGRMGEPVEIAAAALFLASEESSFMTGSELTADGGLGQI